MYLSVIPCSVTKTSWRWQRHQIPARTCHRMWSSVWNREAGLLLNVLGISRWRWQCVRPHEQCGIRGCLSGGLPGRWRVPLGSVPWGCPTVTPIDQLRLQPPSTQLSDSRRRRWRVLWGAPVSVRLFSRLWKCCWEGNTDSRPFIA